MLFKYSLTNPLARWLAISLLATANLPVFADEPEHEHEPNMVGAVVQYGPAYLGSDRSTESIIPVLSLTKNLLFLRTTEGILETGISKPLNETVSYGAQLAYEDGRTQNGFSNGLKFLSINPSMSYGAFLQYEDNIGPMPIDVVLRYRKDIDTSRGSQLDMRVFAGIYGGEHEKLNLGVFAQRTLADRRAMETYYGLKDRFSGRLHHPSYHPDQGVFSSEVGLWGAYSLCPKTYLVGYAEKIFLGSEARHSPITKDANINYFSVGLAFEF